MAEMLGPVDTLCWEVRERHVEDAPSASAPTMSVGVGSSPANNSQILQEMPPELCKLVLKYSLRSKTLHIALCAGRWDVVLELASNPLPFKSEEQVRQQLHAWLTKRLSMTVV
jgi:hypothetical protein